MVFAKEELHDVAIVALGAQAACFTCPVIKVPHCATSEFNVETQKRLHNWSCMANPLKIETRIKNKLKQIKTRVNEKE